MRVFICRAAIFFFKTDQPSSYCIQVTKGVKIVTDFLGLCKFFF